MTTAQRGYVRGEARFNAIIIFGAAALKASKGGINISVRSRDSTSMIDGFQVKTQIAPAFVLISITLNPNAMFNLIFNGVSESEATAIARKFDWKGIQALLN